MTVSSGQKFTGITIELDGNTFKDCQFHDCQILYSGGELPDLSNCMFDHCSWSLTGAAWNTLEFMRFVYPQNPAVIQGFLDHVRKRPDSVH